MIEVNNKKYRNLEEQVLYNTQQVERILTEAELSDLGIKIISVTPLTSADDLPEDYSGEYGDAFLVGTATPYELYVWTRADNEYNGSWFDWGPLNAPSIVPGPPGPQGEQGNPGTPGSKWYIGTVAPTLGSNYLVNDSYLNVTNGNVYQLASNGNWQLIGNIRGPQGIQGLQGIQGVQGLQGIQGVQGEPGEPGKPFTIGGILANTDQLPTPTAENQNVAYLVGTADNYNMYVVVGDTTSPYIWVNLGKVTAIEGPQGPQGIQGPAGPTGPAGADAHPIYLSTYAPTGNYIPVQYLTPTTPKVAVNDYIITVGGELYRVVADQEGMQVQVSYVTSLIGPAGFSPTAVELSGESGTITSGQWSTLQANDLNYIINDGEIFSLADKNNFTGYYIYTHTGMDPTTTQFSTKSIAIDNSALGWIKKVATSGGGGYIYNVTFSNSSSNPRFYLSTQIISKVEPTSVGFVLGENVWNSQSSTNATKFYNLLVGTGHIGRNKMVCASGSEGTGSSGYTHIFYAVYANISTERVTVCAQNITTIGTLTDVTLSGNTYLQVYVEEL